MTSTRTVRIHYRSARYTGDPDAGPEFSFEDKIRAALSGPLGEDCEARAFLLRNGQADKGMINEHDVQSPGVFLEIYHLDHRRDLPFFKRPAQKSKTAKVLSRVVPEDENAMGAAAYLVVRGNHIAAIEPISMKAGALTNYFNALLQAAGELTPAETWKLVPKVQVSDAKALTSRGLRALEVRPHARLVGQGPSQLPFEPNRKKPRALTKRTEERIASGGRLKDLFEVLGAEEADLDILREAMSNDIGIEAKVIFQVRRNFKSTEATLGTDDISQAIASLEEENDVALVSPDGKQRNGLSTLVETGEVLEVGGMLSLPHVSSALTSALMAWGGRGIIDLSGQ